MSRSWASNIQIPTLLSVCIATKGTAVAHLTRIVFNLTGGIDKQASPVNRRRIGNCDRSTSGAHHACISAHDDAAVGELAARAIEKVGPEGAVTVEEAKGTETTMDVVEGLQFDRGYLSPYFVTDAEKMEAVLEDALILLFEGKISNVKDFLPVLEQVAKRGAALLVVAEEVEGEALATLVVNRLRGVFANVAVKAPGFGDRRKAMLQDIAVVTGGQLVAQELGIRLENVTLEHLGRASRVVVDREHTTIVGGKGDKSAIEGRCQELRKQIADTTSERSCPGA